jgi:hypothetical protein
MERNAGIVRQRNSGEGAMKAVDDNRENSSPYSARAIPRRCADSST